MRIFSFTVLAMWLMVYAGCENDPGTSVLTDPVHDVSGLTEFAIAEPEPSGAAYTMGLYTGTGISFYWTEGDKLWVNNAAESPSLRQSAEDDISHQLAQNGDTKTASAKFYFSGTYPDDSYPVRYTGKNNNVGDKVVIASVQDQQSPNDGTHIGTDGDCGTAVATRGADGKFKFVLNHKASYATFTPYYSNTMASSVVITQIKVSADQAMAGEYGFNDSGIDLATRPAANSTNKSITLKLNGNADGGFPIPRSATPSANAAIMVLAPGTYTNFTVEYSLYDGVTDVSTVVSKNYGTLTFAEGRNKKVAANLPLRRYENEVYMWDAQLPYWYGYESEQPLAVGVKGEHYPKSLSADPLRWYNTGDTPTRTAAKCPNVNEMLWYVFKGDPHWDSERAWLFLDHLCNGGMWLKKQAVIAAENGITLAYMKTMGINYRDIRDDYRTLFNWGGDWVKNKNITQHAPSDTTNYFYVPAIGFYLEGERPVSHYFMGYGDNWTSSPAINSNVNALNLGFTKSVIGIYNSRRDKGARAAAFE